MGVTAKDSRIKKPNQGLFVCVLIKGSYIHRQ